MSFENHFIRRWWFISSTKRHHSLLIKRKCRDIITLESKYYGKTSVSSSMMIAAFLIELSVNKLGLFFHCKALKQVLQKTKNSFLVTVSETSLKPILWNLGLGTVVWQKGRVVFGSGKGEYGEEKSVVHVSTISQWSMWAQLNLLSISSGWDTYPETDVNVF